MKGILTWRLGVVSFGATVAVGLIFWNRLKFLPITRKKSGGKKIEDKSDEKYLKDMKDIDASTGGRRKDDIDELPDPRWVKVGKVKELYYYPLKSGRGKDLENCEFTDYGISAKNSANAKLNDRMFLVYNEENGKFVTGRNYPTLILVSLSAIDGKSIRLEAVGMRPLTFELPKLSETDGNVDCTMWWGEPVKCIDCGVAPAEWISNFLTGTNSGLRIGLAPPRRRNLLKGPWKRFTEVYDTLRNEDTGYFSDLASYMLMTESSIEDLNQRLQDPISALQFRPNIVVSGTEPFVEDNWEWIKIGDRAVIRNVKPCPRCAMVKIDPQTGIMDQKEPLETLRNYRAQTDEEKIRVDGRSPVMGIYCGLYLSGNVKVGDDVHVHIPKTVCTTSV